jgi:hypothetical protein
MRHGAERKQTKTAVTVQFGTAAQTAFMGDFLLLLGAMPSRSELRAPGLRLLEAVQSGPRHSSPESPAAANGAPTGDWLQICELHWPAGVKTGVSAATGWPSRPSPNGQRQVAVLTPLVGFVLSVQAKLKQLANVAPSLSFAEQSCISTAVAAGVFFQLLMAWGMWLIGQNNDHTFAGPGAVQLPCIFPPFTSAIAGPLYTGQVQVASGNCAVPPPATFTVIMSPLGVQVEAAHNAYEPLQIW